MSFRRPAKRALILDDDDEEEDTSYSFKVLLPNSTSVGLTLHNPGPEMPMERFVNMLKDEYEKARKDCVLMSKRTRIDWNLGGKFHLETNGEKMKGMVRFAVFKPNMCHIIRLDDGSGTTSTMYENLWDLTPDPDLLKEPPENYSFETALADLIDNSLQAVWPFSDGDRKLISVDVSSDRISVFDTGKGMDSSEANSIDKWGKIGASLHRSQKICGVGGRPPYLKPFFGMFGYGGPYACMFLGRRTLVSSKTKTSKKVFTLQFKKEALMDNRSILGKHWKTDGGMRDPTEEEIKLAPHGSFTKVEIFEPEFDISKLYQLQCRLKDIYFPYIQCDELSKTGKTEWPVEFQVNGENLAEIAGGEVAITNLNSRGEEFWFQIRFSLTSEKRVGRPQEANARLRFVYFPIVQGKESIEKILENLEEEGCKVSESFETFGRVSIRRLGRLLPEVRWDSIPFMKQGNRASTLQKSCQRVKCFVDLDAGFNPTPSKTDLASQNPFSVALRNFGSKSIEKEKDTDVKIMIHREEKQLNNKQLEQTYRDWVTKMHNTHDEEATSGQDEPTLVVELDKKALNISHDAVRVHKVIMRKGKSWKRGQNIKILKGACAGVHNGNVYATIDYFLIEGFEDEPGGDTRILCRPINLPKNKGCMLSIIDGTPSLEVKSSLSLPIAIIDSGKCLHVGADEWNTQLEKQQEKAPSKIDLLDERACNELKIDGELPVGDPVRAGRAPPKQIVAVVRPACFTSSTPQKKLDQKHIVKDGEEMVMVVKRLDTNMKSSDKKWSWSCSQRVFPTSRDGISGLYIFSLGSKFSNLFEKAGTYNFSFSVGDSIRCKKEVVVRPSKAASWKLEDNLEPAVRVGSSLPPFCVACFDEYDNRVPFASVPSLDVKLEANPGFQLEFDKIEAKLIEGRSILKIENMVVETDELDKIRPNYEATLEIRAKDKPFAVSVACKVIPGPVERVAMNNPHALDNLLPGSTVDTLILEIFDEYNNHVAEGTDVLLHIDGYRIQDWMGVIRKVDASGCIDLSGILKVTEGYGKSVSFSVMSGIEEIFKKESQIQERELRLITELPVSCAAGSNIQNLIFNVTDSDGSVDATIHYDEKSGCFHTMSIESGSGNIQSGIRYAFIHGSCRVPTLSVPENESVFSFRVFHSRFPELHVNLEIPLMPALTFERDEIGCSTPYSKTTTTPQSKMASTTNPGLSPTPSVGLGLTPCSQFGVLAIRSSSLDNSSQTGLIDMTQFTESLKQKLDIYGAQKMKIDERLKCLEAEQGQAEQELSTLQASLGTISAAFPECLSTRESMMRQIEEKQHDTAAAVFCCLYRKAAPPQSMFLSNKGVFGIVALLGSVASTSLSRVLSEYLGKDTMLALVCKSSQCGPMSVEYMRLQSEAALLNRSITSRFLIICLDATRPWSSGLVKNDPQRKLAMDNPCLPNGDPIPGFIGYAVNMIELDLADLDIQTNSGHGLRETLFYGVFGDLQVYETGEYLQAALPHINEDAVSLDGVIFKENGFIYSGCCKPEIHFPITVTEKQEKTLVKLELTRDRKRKAEKMMAEENCSLRKLEKKLKKATQKYQNFTAAMADS
uniref:Protein DEFECTIVE IN MERISTEM SILENCING 3 n=2 Tax=Noccaea caerulescens TaxID=107243 RepID=A0A1J3I4J6_NOCCA